MSRKEIGFYILLLFVLAVPISPFVSTRILVLLLVLSLFFGTKRLNFFDLLKKSWDVFIYILIIVLGLLYSSDQVAAIRTLETNFAFLALPIICFRISDFNRDRIIKISLFFSLGIAGASLICLVNAILRYLNEGHNKQVFFFYDLTNIIGSHPTYFAYYLIFAITFCLYVLTYGKSPLPKWLLIAFAFFFFTILFLTGGQTAFISLLLVFSYFVLRFMVEQKTASRKITFSLICFMITFMFFGNSIDFGNRLSMRNDSWERFDLWESAIRATPNIFVGVGTGDYKLLNEYYLTHNMSQFAEGSYNAHNQFIQIFFTNGVLGLLAILIMIARPLYLSVRHQNSLGVLVFFPFLIYGMTEVFLGRYQGVAFFALFHQCFVAHYQRDTPAFSLKSN